MKLAHVVFGLIPSVIMVAVLPWTQVQQPCAHHYGEYVPPSASCPPEQVMNLGCLVGCEDLYGEDMADADTALCVERRRIFDEYLAQVTKCRATWPPGSRALQDCIGGARAHCHAQWNQANADFNAAVSAADAAFAACASGCCSAK